MSIKAMTWVWDNSEAQGTELLCLLALADYANDEGEAYPGVQRLAHRCRVGERAIRKVLRSLEEMGEIETVFNKGIATSTGHTNRYRLIKYIQGGNYCPPHKGKGGTVVPKGGNGGSPLGGNGGSPDPSVLTNRDPSEELAPQVFAAQTPPVESHRKGKAKKEGYTNEETGVSTKAILEEYVLVLSTYEPRAVIAYEKEGAAARRLAKAGWRPPQVAQTIRYLKEDKFYGQGHLSLQTVATQIAAHHARQVAGLCPSPGQLSFSVGDLL